MTGPARLPASRLRRVGLLPLLLLLGSCERDPTEPPSTHGEVGVVVNSIELSATLFVSDDPEQRTTVGLAPEGSPVSVAVSGRWAAVPLGVVPAVAVVDIEVGEVARTVPLPAGSGATGAAFVNDSVVLVANPGRGTVTPVDVVAGTTGGEIPAGTYPQAVIRVGSRVAVVNSGLGPDFQPGGPGTVTVLDAGTLAPLGTVTLTAENSGSGAPAPDGRLWVVNSGRFGQGDGSLSLVDLSTMAEVERHEGFGEFPYSVAAGSDGRVYVGSFAYGVAVWDAAGRTFVHGPEEAVAPGGVPSTSGLALDGEGRLWALLPECQGPGVAHRLGTGFQVQASVPTGVCPIAIAFRPRP